MKLSDIKSEIDNYFDKITAEELYNLSVEKYGFLEDLSVLPNNNIKNISTISLSSNEGEDKFDDSSSENNYPLAA